MKDQLLQLFYSKHKIISDKYHHLLSEEKKYLQENNFTKIKVINKDLSFYKKLFFLSQKAEEEKQEISNLKKALLEETDSDLKKEFNNEITNLSNNIQNIFEEFLDILKTLEEDFEKAAILEIQGTSGGDEANLFCGELYKMYVNYASKQGWKVNVINLHESFGGGISKVLFEIKGKNVYGLLCSEAGVHRVQRVPKTESKGRVHTSAAAVSVLPIEKNLTTIKINPKDLKIDTYRASGAGGQHVNKTDSAVRITHLPTNIVAQSQDGRSQLDNKETAMRILEARLLEQQITEQKEKTNEAKKASFGSGDRSEKIRTYNFPQDRITDHRLTMSWNNIFKILNGNLDDLISAIQNFKKLKLLENFN